MLHRARRADDGLHCAGHPLGSQHIERQALSMSPGARPAATRAPRSSIRDGVVPISASCRFLCTCSGPSSGGKAKSSTLYDGGRFHKQIGRAAMQHVFR